MGNIYHQWNGTVLTITSDSGTSSANLKGDDGCRGPQGVPGNTKSFEEELAIERARIDNIVALEEGSTTGDAELVDIRIGYDGAVYESAGGAVRAQVGAMVDDIEDLNNALFDIEVITASKNKFNPNEATQEYLNENNYIVSGVIPCSVGDSVKCSFNAGDGSLVYDGFYYGIRQINSDGATVITGYSYSPYNNNLVVEHSKIPDLIGVQVLVKESFVSFDNRANIIITINEEPEVFEAWREAGETKVSLIEKNREELQVQINNHQAEYDGLVGDIASLQEQIDDLAEAGAVSERVSEIEAVVFREEQVTCFNEFNPNTAEYTTISNKACYLSEVIPCAVGDKLYAGTRGDDGSFVNMPVGIRQINADGNFAFTTTSASWGYTVEEHSKTPDLIGVRVIIWEDKLADNALSDVMVAFGEIIPTAFYPWVEEGIVKINIIQENKEQLQAQINDINSDLVALGKSRWENKNVLVFGDSISSDTYMNNSIKWNHYLAEQKGFIHHNYSIHGYGFLCGQNTTTLGDYSMIKQIEAAKSAGVEPDLIILFMGTNDAGNHVALGDYDTGMNKSTLTTSITDTTTITTFTAAVEYCMAKILEYWAGAPVVVILPLKRTGYVNPEGAYYLGKYADVIQTTAEKFAFPVLDLFHKGYFNPENAAFKAKYTNDYDGSGTGDGLHPTQEWATTRLAPTIGNFIENV